VISLAHGGLERLVVDWTNARNARHPASTLVCCLDEPDALAAELEADCCFALGADRSRFPWDRAALGQLRSRLAGSDRIDVLHSHNIGAQQYAALAARRAATRHVHTEHGSNVHVKGLFNRMRLRRLGRMTDRIVAVSRDTAGKMAGHWGLPPDGVTVIANGVTPHPAYSAEQIDALRRELEIPERAFIVGSVGRLAHEKGYDRLIGILPSVLRPPSSVFCLLVGDGPERTSLESRADQLGIADRFIITGFREEARRFYELMDVFILPSRSEGLSISLLEAMVAGCPVAVTDVGESREVIADGEAGIVLPRDEGEWASPIAEQMADGGGQRTEARAQAARERVAREYSFEATLEAYEALYVEVAG